VQKNATAAVLSIKINTSERSSATLMSRKGQNNHRCKDSIINWVIRQLPSLITANRRQLS
jgi:hypothetical protein